MQLAIIGYHGVICETPDGKAPPPRAWRPIRGSLEAIARMHRAGWRVIVTANQPEIADGSIDPDTLIRQHDAMRRRVAENGGVIDAVFYCPHSPADGCSCHMPSPGLLHDISNRLHVSLDGVPLIGDSLAHVQAARSAGAMPVLVKTGKGFGTVSLPELDPAVPVFNDLYSAVNHLLDDTGTPGEKPS